MEHQTSPVLALAGLRTQDSDHHRTPVTTMLADMLKPDAEALRVAALEQLGILDTTTSAYFDAITQLCAELFDMPGAYISLIDSERQWVKSSVGFCPPQSREESFCNHTIQQAAVMVIADATLDPRFMHNPLVVGPANIRFYAGAPLITADGYAIGALCLTDTVARQFPLAQQQQLQRLAELLMSHVTLRRAVSHVDAVSGMPNKYQLEEDLSALSQRFPGQTRTLVALDLPDSSAALEIASVLGVAVYDEMIRGGAARLRQLFKGRAQVYHISDARFFVLSDDAATDFLDFVYRQEAALEQPLLNLNVPLNLTSFGGVVSFELSPSASQDAPRKAALAVNRALVMQQRWAVYDEQHDVSHQRAFRLLNDVHEGLRNGAFHLEYQPKHDLSHGGCLSAEALLRWKHPELGLVSPAEFIPLVEKTALIGPLSHFVIEAAIAQTAEWHAAGFQIKIAINLSAYNFEEADIVERLADTCRRYALDARYVEIECTEGTWMESPQILATLHRIRALGMSLALDDFGTGYSNFSYLQKVPATSIKVDQSLIRNVHTNQRDQRIVRSLIALARELDYQVIAEGVETEQSLNMIKEWGCDIAQGYHFAKPLAVAAFAQHMLRFSAPRAHAPLLQ